MNKKSKKNREIIQLVLLPIATMLYIFGVVSITALVAILIVFLMRGSTVIFEGATWDKLLFIVVGALVFFPARKFRNSLMRR